MPFLSQLFQEHNQDVKALVYSSIIQMLVRPVRDSQVSSELQKEIEKIFTHERSTMSLFTVVY